MVYNYTAVGVSGSQKGDNFRVMDRVLIGAFDITIERHKHSVHCKVPPDITKAPGQRRFPLKYNGKTLFRFSRVLLDL